jgi:hypothetical protein
VANNSGAGGSGGSPGAQLSLVADAGAALQQCWQGAGWGSLTEALSGSDQAW